MADNKLIALIIVVLIVFVIWMSSPGNSSGGGSASLAATAAAAPAASDAGSPSMIDEMANDEMKQHDADMVAVEQEMAKTMADHEKDMAEMEQMKMVKQVAFQEQMKSSTEQPHIKSMKTIAHQEDLKAMDKLKEDKTMEVQTEMAKLKGMMVGMKEQHEQKMKQIKQLKEPKPGLVRPMSGSCYAGIQCQPSNEAWSDKNRVNAARLFAHPPHDPGHDIYGHELNDNYCRYGLTQEGIVDGENDLWRFQVYTVQPSMMNLKFLKAQM